jgi:cell division protein FtsW (lipid II flippase)
VALSVFFGRLFSKRKNLSSTQEARTLFDFRVWDQPLFGSWLDYISYSLFCSILAFLLILGPHVGTDMYYAYQLVVPLFFYWLCQRIRFDNKFAGIIAMVIVFNLFWFGYKTVNPNLLRQEDPKKWSKLIRALESSTKVLNSPVAAANAVELGLSPIDSGQTIYFYAVQRYQGNILLGPSFDAFQSDGMQYVQSIEDSIKLQEFDLIMTTDGEPSFYHEDLLNKYYAIDAEVKVNMPQTSRTWKVFLWRPLPK